MIWHRNPLTIVLFFVFLSSLGIITGSTDVHCSEQSIEVTGNAKDEVGSILTISMIEAVGLDEVTVYDPFEKSERSYSGVMLSTFMEQFGKPGTTKAVFKAIDDYEIAFTLEELEKTRILVVTRAAGQHIGLTEKGPVRIVYPDYDPQLHNSKEIMPRWIWMIQAVHFE